MTGRGAPWARYAWAAGIVFVLALLVEVAISVGIPVNQDDSAAKIASELDEHRKRMLAVACLSIVYAVAFVIYLWRLHDLLRGSADRREALSSSSGPCSSSRASASAASSTCSGWFST